MKINISIDDISPHPLSSTKVLNRCYELIEVFPNIKFSLFVPIAYWRTLTQKTDKPLLIATYPEFCEELTNLNPNNFEICYHGYHHGIQNVSNNDEFKNVNREQAEELIAKMERYGEFSCDIPFKQIFRPPAWKMSEDALKVFTEQGYLLALSHKEDAKQLYNDKEKNSKVVYYDCSPPYKPLIHKDKNEIVFHACEWDWNYLNTEKTKELEKFIKEKDYEFCFLEDML